LHNFDSQGPEGRVRGNASQVYEKYVTLARDATSSGDRIAAEGYYQFAEHYFRVMNDTTDPQRPGQDQSRYAQEPRRSGFDQPRGGGNGRDSGEAPRAARAPVDATPVDGTPVDGTPVDGMPADGTPVDGTPVDATPADAARTGPPIPGEGPQPEVAVESPAVAEESAPAPKKKPRLRTKRKVKAPNGPEDSAEDGAEENGSQAADGEPASA
jgi:hypothetical protein